MFYPFKPQRQPRPVKSDPATDRLATRIFSRSLKLQRQCADFLNKKTKKLSPQSLKTTLIIIAVAAGKYNIFLIASGFWGKPPGSVFLRMKTQLLADQAASRQRKQQAFEAYLDSLEKAFIRDSINESNHKK